MWVNQVPAKNSAALSQVYHTVFFCPDDLYLIREGAAARRRFMDTALCQLRPRYAAALAEYHRLYDHKTRILRDSEERPDLLELLPDFNERMVRFGAVLVHYRRQFAEALNRYAARHHRECSGGRERLEITYQTVSSVTDPAAEVEVLTEQLRVHMESHQAAPANTRCCCWMTFAVSWIPAGRSSFSTASRGGRCSLPAAKMIGCRSFWVGRCSM